MSLEGTCGGLTDFGCDNLLIQDEGVSLGGANTLNFTGAGVTATVVNGVGTITITGGGGGGSSAFNDITSGTNTTASMVVGTGATLSAIGSGTISATTSSTLATGRTIAITGDLTYTSPSFNGSTNVTAAGTLATVNTNVGTFGSATQSYVGTVNAKGLTTAASQVTITPAIGSITGLGTGVATFLENPSSANLAAAITDETGTGALVFANTPTLTTAILGSSTATTQSPGDNSTKLATTAYVQAAIFATTTLPASKYATTAALPTATYSNGSSGVGATLTGVGLGALSIDGSTPSVNDIILVKNQASTFQNGIYSVTVVGSVGAAFVLTRATYYNTSLDIDLGDNTFVTSGSTLANTTWTQNGTQDPVIGTDPITFAQTTGAASYTAGNGISITGTSIAIDTSITVDKTTSQALTNKSVNGVTLVNGGTPTLYLSQDGTYTTPSGGSGDNADSTWFGDGSDGNVTISSGTTTLLRDMYYDTLTMSGTGVLNNGGFRVFCKTNLDISAAQAGAIIGRVPTASNNGSASPTSSGGNAVTALLNTNLTVPGGMSSTAGGAGATGVASPTAAQTTINSMGGVAGGGGNGERGGNGSGAAGTAQSANTPLAGNDFRYASQNQFILLNAIFFSAQGGNGGSGGGGDGTNGGGGGSGGLGGSGIVINAKNIARGGSTATGTILGVGANGGNGGNGTTGNRGGGAGGHGGGGSAIYIIYKTLSGSTATNAIQAKGGNGGNGGAGAGAGGGGYGGAGGKGGVVVMAQIGGPVTVSTGTRTAAPAGLAGGAPSGTTAGTGTTGETLSVSI